MLQLSLAWAAGGSLQLYLVGYTDFHNQLYLLLGLEAHLPLV